MKKLRKPTGLWLALMSGIGFLLITAVVQALPFQQVPTNDDFTNALMVTAVPYTNTQNTTAATTQVNDPDFPCIANNATTNFRQGWHSVWYAVTPPVDGTMALNTLASNYDTVLAVWSGTFGALTNIGCNDDANFSRQSSLNVSVSAGTIYYVEVAGYDNGSSGTLQLSIDQPWNDDFDFAYVMGSMPYSYTQSTVTATTAADDPTLSCGWAGPSQHSHSVWYAFTPTSDGVFHVDTAGSGFDTVLAAWTGVRGSLVEQACNDDVDLGGGVLASVIDFQVSSGITYYIEVASFSTTNGGSLSINADFTPTPPFSMCTDALQNGGFESGLSFWSQGGSPAAVTNPVYAGSLSARLGNRNRANDSLTQNIALPANTTIAVLRFRWRLTSNDSRIQKRDFLYARIRDSAGTNLAQIFPIDNTYVLNSWQQVTLIWPGASAYAGQTIQVYFQGSTDNNNSSAFYLDGATFEVCPSAAPLLNIVKTDAPDPVIAGQTLTYTLAYSNTGTMPATNVRITDTIPTGFTFGGLVSANPPLTQVSTAPPVWITPTLAVGASGTMVFTGTVSSSASGSLSNLVTIADDLVSRSDSEITAVTTPASLISTLTAGPASVTIGQPITVTMTVNNTGQITATNVSPSALTMAGTGAAVYASGPLPATAVIPPGGSQSFAWVYPAVSPGLVHWTGNAAGTDALLGSSVVSPITSSNDVTIAPPITMEVGTVQVDHNWVTVNLTNTYNSMVVIASVDYNNNNLAVVSRVRNAAGATFDVKLQNPAGITPLNAETVHYLVMEAGAYTLPGSGSRAVEAQRYLSTITDYRNNWNGQAQTYLNAYTNPVVVGQVMTENDPNWSAFWDRGNNRRNPPDATTLFTGKMVGRDGNTTRADETVGFVVIEQGNGTTAGAAYEAALGADRVRGVRNNPPYPYNFNVPFVSPPQIGLISQAAMDDNNGGWGVLYGANPLTANSIDLAIDEDSNRRHSTEQVAYLVFERPFALTPYDLAINKSGAPDPVIAGNTLTYTLTFTNSGYAGMTNVQITDNLPAEVAFGGVIASPLTATLISTAPPVWSLPSLVPGATSTVVFTGTVSSAASGVVTNTAAIAASQTDIRPVNNTAVITTTVLQPAIVDFITDTFSVDENAGSAILTVTLNAPFSQPINVNYTTSDNTAVAGSDYLTSTGSLTFIPGVVTQTFAVTILDDLFNETDETVTVTLSSPGSGAALGGNNPASLTILDDDGVAPNIQFNNTSYSLVESGGSATINVSLSAPSGLPVTVDYAASSGTAAAGVDYTPAGGTLTFTTGITNQTFLVSVLPDVLDENDETLFLTLSNPTNGVITGTNPITFTILDDDNPPQVQFVSTGLTVNENGGTAVLPVSLSAPSGLTVTVNYATSSGTAVAGSDFVTTSGLLTFPPGVTTRNVNVPLINDGVPEANEAFQATLSGSINAGLGSVNPTTITIMDDDVSVGQVTIDKIVSPAVGNNPGQWITYTYTITINNAGPSRVHIRQITDTLPAGFAYVGTIGTAGIRGPDGISINGRDVTWNYNNPLPAINAGQSATLTFTARSNNSAGSYCNSAGATVQGSIGTVSRSGLACVTINWPEYTIITQAGSLTIRVRVRLVNGSPMILSWEIQ